MPDAFEPSEPEQPEFRIERPQISHWIWQPWYAKLWWALASAYWTIGIGALWFSPLTEFYTSHVAGLLYIVFFPVFAFLILSIGWFRAWVYALNCAAAHPEAQSKLGWSWSGDAYDERMRRWADFHHPNNIYSPLSGTMFVGNSENPLRRSLHR